MSDPGEATGVLVHLPTAELPAGRNLLEVARKPSKKDDEDDEDDDRHHYYIPFWR